MGSVSANWTSEAREWLRTFDKDGAKCLFFLVLSCADFAKLGSELVL